MPRRMRPALAGSAGFASAGFAGSAAAALMVPGITPQAMRAPPPPSGLGVVGVVVAALVDHQRAAADVLDLQPGDLQLRPWPRPSRTPPAWADRRRGRRRPVPCAPWWPRDRSAHRPTGRRSSRPPCRRDRSCPSRAGGSRARPAGRPFRLVCSSRPSFVSLMVMVPTRFADALDVDLVDGDLHRLGRGDGRSREQEDRPEDGPARHQRVTADVGAHGADHSPMGPLRHVPMLRGSPRRRPGVNRCA